MYFIKRGDVYYFEYFDKTLNKLKCISTRKRKYEEAKEVVSQLFTQSLTDETRVR
jgi:hypothetical protein